MRRIRGLAAAFAVGCCLWLSGCGSSIEDDPILRLSAEEALIEGKALFEQEKFGVARKYLTHAFEVEPNSQSGREALLLAADSYFFQGGEVNYVQAEAKYRDFLNRFPTSALGDYVQFQIANSLAERIGKPNRDQGTTRKALDAYVLLQELYPTSEYAAELEERLTYIRSQLAEHEFIVGEFYLSTRNPLGAISRFEELLEDYPAYAERDKVLFHLIAAFKAADEKEKAEATRARLQQEHPSSEYISRL